MFTGIIEGQGIVTTVRSAEEGGVRLGVRAGAIAADARPGASIAVSGVCLTVAGRGSDTLEFDVVPETLRRTTLGRLREGGAVNLERSIRAGDRMDGHFVQGHVDGRATVVRVITNREHVVWLAPESQLAGSLVHKGSVAVDGVSLTIAELTDDAFSVALIPATLERTTLGRLQAGDQVNIETDILVRIVVQQLARAGAIDPTSLNDPRPLTQAPAR